MNPMLKEENREKLIQEAMKAISEKQEEVIQQADKIIGDVAQFEKEVHQVFISSIMGQSKN